MPSHSRNRPKEPIEPQARRKAVVEERKDMAWWVMEG